MALGHVVERLLVAKTWPGVEGRVWSLLDEIAHRSLDPKAATRRTALAKALGARWPRAAGRNERVFLLRLLALVGDDPSVPLLSAVLEGDDHVLREYALRALQENPSPRAGELLLTALEKERASRWRIALACALGARGDGTLRRRLADLAESEADEEVKAALEAAGAAGS